MFTQIRDWRDKKMRRKRRGGRRKRRRRKWQKGRLTEREPTRR